MQKEKKYIPKKGKDKFLNKEDFSYIRDVFDQEGKQYLKLTDAKQSFSQ